MTLTPTSAKGGSGSGGGAVTQICLATLGADSPSFDTNAILGGNIPQTYTHLLFELSVRTTVAAVTDLVNLRFNNDATGSYDYEFYSGQGATFSGTEAFAATQALIGYGVGATGVANERGQVSARIPFYTGTVFDKTMIAHFARKYGTATGNLWAGQSGVSWRNAGAITRITIFPGTGPNFLAGSQFALYGLT